jgi:NAD(P)-dependent dehydrogenase (short-subunit alcohol dehydrogenase family)
MAVVLITGCSEGGLGYELAKAFMNEAGVEHVVATARNCAAMKGLESGCQLLALDVGSEICCRAVVEEVLKQHGRIDILVNNAGQLCISSMAEVPLAEAKSCFDVNVWGPLQLIQVITACETLTGPTDYSRGIF